MSLRLRLMAAFAYVLVLVLGAIEIPFALSIRSRIDAEVRAQAVNEAHLIAASASGRLDAGRSRSSASSIAPPATSRRG